jgi:uroporphyrinogen-III synthase
MSAAAGPRIVLFEARLEEPLAALVRKRGGIPICVPAVREHRLPVAAQVTALIAELTAELAAGPGADPRRGWTPVVIFSTGVGAAGLFDEARELGLGGQLRDAVRRGVSVCRGPKPVAALFREGITTSIKASSPHTTTELLAALAGVELAGRLVVVVHHGERNQPLLDLLAGRGARVRELFLYEWLLPEDQGPLRAAVDELVQGGFAAAAFTTQIQARHLLAVAGSLGRRDAVLEALRTKVIVAAIGPTCARVLEELGIRPQVVADPPKLGPLLAALFERLSGEAAA